MNIELDRNTVEGKRGSDFITYKERMTKLKEELAKLKKREPFFVVQSRKGPKVLEMFFSKKERINMKILTEHALPFLFPILAILIVNVADNVLTCCTTTDQSLIYILKGRPWCLITKRNS